MDNTINKTIIEKVVCKNVAIYKAIAMLPPPPFEDKFAKKEILCQNEKNTQNQSLEKCLNEPELNNEKKVENITNEIKVLNELENWRTITDPKLRKKLRKKESSKRYYQKYKDHVKQRVKDWSNTNKDRVKKNYKLWKEKNRQYLIAYKREWQQKNKLGCNLRKRLCCALKNNQKSGSAVRDLGCTIEELKSYLESKFQPGMTWDNWGQYGWHIDHIRPLANFDLTNHKQLLEACHYTNLQPLWWQDNLSKGCQYLDARKKKGYSDPS